MAKPRYEDMAERFADVRQAQSLVSDPREPDNVVGELIELTELRKCWLEYWTGITAIVLVHPSSRDNPQLLLHDGRGRLKEHENNLLRLQSAGYQIYPLEEVPGVASNAILGAVTAPRPQSTAALDEIDQKTDEVVHSLDEEKELHAGTSDPKERAERESRIAALEAKLAALEGERNEAVLARDRALQRSGDVRVLEVFEHRQQLERALREARHEVIIVSPWLTRDAVDDALLLNLGRALERGVTVVIGYGIGADRRDTRATEFQRTRQESVLQNLRHLQGRQYRGRLVLHEVGNTHQKILVCDRTFAVSSSFNWLSFRGDPKLGLRRETGLLVTQKRAVEDLARSALAGFPREVLTPVNSTAHTSS